MLPRAEARLKIMIASTDVRSGLISDGKNSMNPTAELSDNSYVNLTRGDPAQESGYTLDIAAGHHIVLCFYVTSADAPGSAAVQKVLANQRRLDQSPISFFGLSLDARGAESRIQETIPGEYEFVLNYDWTISRLYGSIPKDAQRGKAPLEARRVWMVLDPMLRVLLVVPFAPDGSDVAALFGFLDELPLLARFAGIERHAPILFLPYVFEEEFCRRLVGLYQAHGGEETGVWDVIGGKAVPISGPRT